ncbi:hypothetical protein [Anabaena catenula]|uniref:hypothetical protein n=1 Tax=Anabaena catenula TaxID=1296320 RepID=UPI0018F020C5|nr:hypothetical protein [Anabaena catenula]
MATNTKTAIKAEQYPFAQELITDIEGNVKKVVIDFHDYLRLLEATEDEGIILAMQEVKHETPHYNSIAESFSIR